MVQFEHEGKINVINLACRSVLEQHTGINIKNWLREILGSYGIKDSLVLAFTTDSASNMQKAAKEYLSDLDNNKFLVFDQRFDYQHQEYEEYAYEARDDLLLDGDENEPLDDFEYASEDPDDNDHSLANRMIPTSYRVPCVVHQAQLAINKWCEEETIKRALVTVRVMAKLLRTQKLIRLLKVEKLPIAVIDQTTRWSSKFRMIDSLLKLSDQKVQ